MAVTLLGPLELHLPRPDTTIAPSLLYPFTEEAITLTPDPPRGHTSAAAATYLSSGNPCLDLFFHVVPTTPSSSLNSRLQQAWAHSPLLTLKLICNLRGVRGTGKSDREGFFSSATWLHSHHPKTLACNIGPIAGSFGCLKHLPELLFRLIKGSDIRQRLQNEWNVRKTGRTRVRPSPFRKNKDKNKDDKNPKKKKKNGLMTKAAKTARIEES